jgi:hypothetical protein
LGLGLGSGLEEHPCLGAGLGLGLGLGLEERAWLGVGLGLGVRVSLREHPCLGAGLGLGLGLGLEERAWCRLTLIDETERGLVGRLAWRGGGVAHVVSRARLVRVAVVRRG